MSYCAGHDPILAAPGFTTDAEWVGRLILAAYELDHARGCHSGWDDSWAMLADPAATADLTRFCSACKIVLPERWWPAVCDAHRCAGATAQGTRCGNSAKDDGLCRTHAAARQRRNQAAP